MYPFPKDGQEVADFVPHLHLCNKVKHTCSQGEASYRYPLLARAKPPAYKYPLAVGFAEFALDKTALGHEAAVSR